MLCCRDTLLNLKVFGYKWCFFCDAREGCSLKHGLPFLTKYNSSPIALRSLVITLIQPITAGICAQVVGLGSKRGMEWYSMALKSSGHSQNSLIHGWPSMFHYGSWPSEMKHTWCKDNGTYRHISKRRWLKCNWSIGTQKGDLTHLLHAHCVFLQAITQIDRLATRISLTENIEEE